MIILISNTFRDFQLLFCRLLACLFLFLSLRWGAGLNVSNFFTFLSAMLSRSYFAQFQTTSGGATWKEKPMDFATIAVKLKSSTSYGLDQMVLDLALIVNNALAMDATFSCAGRLLDVKLLTLLQMYPSLRQRYKTYRSEKRSSSISETNDASISNQTSPCVNSLPPNPKSLSKKPASEESPKFAEHSSPRKKLKTSSETTAKEEHSPSVEVAKPAKIKQKLDIDKHKTSSSKSDEAQKTASSSDSTNGAKTPNELTKTSMTKENQNASSVVTFLNPPPVNSSSNSATVSKPSSASSSVSQFVQKVEVDEVVDICHKILRDIQSKTNYQVFQNVTEVLVSFDLERKNCCFQKFEP